MPRPVSPDVAVAVIGGGVVGAALIHALARRDVAGVLLEAEADLALAASGTNSGILHTGFDSVPGELETRLLVRSNALRDEVLDDLAVPIAALRRRPEPPDGRRGAHGRRHARDRPAKRRALRAARRRRARGARGRR